MLPSLDGRAICKTLRDREIAIPVLVLTARNEIDSKVDLLQIGADDYLTKPFSFEELVARAEALLRRPAASLPTVLSVGDISLNLAERTAHKGEKPLKLTLKEFMRHAGEAVNREDLLSHVWDFNYDSFSNVVDVHVKNLRRKLDDTSNQDILQTVRGIGYRLVQ
jgi:DNA-binding response OmpR family regulator